MDGRAIHIESVHISISHHHPTAWPLSTDHLRACQPLHT